MTTFEKVIDGLFFPEGPRWRAEERKLYFSDILSEKVQRIDESGSIETVFLPGEPPSGLGFLAGGDLLVVATESHKILRLSADVLQRSNAMRTDAEVHADISTQFGTGNNDMVVAPNGTAYAGAYLPGLSEEFPPGPTNPPRFGNLVMVRPDGTAQIVSDRVCFPNGGAITPDGKRLILAESFAHTLTQWDINNDGTLSNRRPFAHLGAAPDGLCLDAEGCIWVACPYFAHGDSGGYVRVADGGEIKEVIAIEESDKSAYACMLGGADGRDLYLCESTLLSRDRHPGDGRIRKMRVDVPRAENQY